MKFLAALAGLGLASISPALAAPAPQPLAISLTADRAQTTQLPAYDPSVPIRVSVRPLAAAHVAAVRIDATGPNGAALHVPLRRLSDGSFVGSLTLGDVGTWNVQLASRTGGLGTTTAAVALTVQAPPPSNAGLIGAAVGTSMFVFFGLGGFVVLRRKPVELQRAG
jgi:hypothetical protein